MGECQDFPSKVFCLTVPKTFAGESFTVAISSGIQKVWLRGWSIEIFHLKIFVSLCRKISYGNPSALCSRKNPVAKKFMDKRGDGRIKIFGQIFSISQCRKTS